MSVWFLYVHPFCFCLVNLCLANYVILLVTLSISFTISLPLSVGAAVNDLNRKPHFARLFALVFQIFRMTKSYKEIA